MNRVENRPSGRLTVAVYTANGALPVEGVTVTVSGAEDGNRDILYTVTTDRSGRTPTLSLPAKPPSDSLTPGYDGRPYAVYDIRVVKDGYYVHENRAAPVFSGITSLQQAELIPLARYEGTEANPRSNLIFNSEI